MGQQEDRDVPAGSPPAPGLRPDALARGRACLRRGPAPSEVLAAAMLDAHAQLRSRVLD